jgi:serine protease
MLDAGGAVAAVASGAFVNLSFQPAAAVAGTPIDFVITGTETAPGRTVDFFEWTLLDGGGIATGFSTATNAATASLTPTGAGSLRVRLTVADSQGGTASTEQRITVSAPAAPPPPTSSGGGDSGGGALSTVWLALLAVAVAGLRGRPLRT